ncbi:hypothetical protein ABZ912_45955 [Nonomuraea angiospora]|uniref:hypothetical protein n=1 Tax=Nonomuraea angiospora TaxID=46172 RepID=UPI0033D0BB38
MSAIDIRPQEVATINRPGQPAPAQGATWAHVLALDAGYGHQHVFLPTSPGEGALTPDTEPEGSHDS